MGAFATAATRNDEASSAQSQKNIQQISKGFKGRGDETIETGSKLLAKRTELDVAKTKYDYAYKDAPTRAWPPNWSKEAWKTAKALKGKCDNLEKEIKALEKDYNRQLTALVEYTDRNFDAIASNYNDGDARKLWNALPDDKKKELMGKKWDDLTFPEQKAVTMAMWDALSSDGQKALRIYDDGKATDRNGFVDGVFRERSGWDNSPEMMRAMLQGMKGYYDNLYNQNPLLQNLANESVELSKRAEENRKSGTVKGLLKAGIDDFAAGMHNQELGRAGTGLALGDLGTYVGNWLVKNTDKDGKFTDETKTFRKAALDVGLILPKLAWSTVEPVYNLMAKPYKDGIAMTSGKTVTPDDVRLAALECEANYLGVALTAFIAGGVAKNVVMKTMENLVFRQVAVQLEKSVATNVITREALVEAAIKVGVDPAKITLSTDEKQISNMISETLAKKYAAGEMGGAPKSFFMNATGIGAKRKAYNAVANYVENELALTDLKLPSIGERLAFDVKQLGPIFMTAGKPIVKMILLAPKTAAVIGRKIESYFVIDMEKWRIKDFTKLVLSEGVSKRRLANAIAEQSEGYAARLANAFRVKFKDVAIGEAAVTAAAKGPLRCPKDLYDSMLRGLTEYYRANPGLCGGNDAATMAEKELKVFIHDGLTNDLQAIANKIGTSIDVARLLPYEDYFRSLAILKSVWSNPIYETGLKKIDTPALAEYAEESLGEKVPMQYKGLGKAFTKAVKSMTSEPVKETYSGMKNRLKRLLKIIDNVESFRIRVNALIEKERINLDAAVADREMFAVKEKVVTQGEGGEQRISYKINYQASRERVDASLEAVNRKIEIKTGKIKGAEDVPEKLRQLNHLKTELESAQTTLNQALAGNENAKQAQEVFDKFIDGAEGSKTAKINAIQKDIDELNIILAKAQGTENGLKFDALVNHFKDVKKAKSLYRYFPKMNILGLGTDISAFGDAVETVARINKDIGKAAAKWAADNKVSMTGWHAREIEDKFLSAPDYFKYLYDENAAFANWANITRKNLTGPGVREKWLEIFRTEASYGIYMQQSAKDVILLRNTCRALADKAALNITLKSGALALGAGAIYASYAVPYVGAISGTIMGGVAEYQLGMFMINIAKENPVLYASLIGPVLPGVTLETVETAPTIGFDKASGTLSFKDTAMPEPAHVELAIGGMNNGPDSQILFGKKKTDMWDGSPIQLDMATIAKYPLNDQGKWEIAYKNDNPKLTTQDRNHPICVDVPSNAIINGEGKWEITVNTQTKPEKIIVDVPTQLVFEGDNRSMNIPFGRELFVKMSGQVNGSGPLNGLQSDMNIPGTYQYDVYNTASDPAPLFQITAIVK